MSVVALRQPVVGEQFVGALLLDRVLHAIRGADARDESGRACLDRSQRAPPAVHRLPGPARSLVRQPQHVVAHHRLAGVADAQEVAPVAVEATLGERATDKLDELAAVGRACTARQRLYVDGQLADALAQPIQQVRRNSLARRRRVSPSSMPISSRPPAPLAKPTQRSGQIVPIGRLAGDHAQRLAVDVLVFEAHTAISPLIRRGSSRSRAARSFWLANVSVLSCSTMG